MKKINLTGAAAAPLLMLVLALPAYADSTAVTPCKDGTTSTATGRGACSSHGGVQKAAAAASASTPAAPAATPAPAGAASKSSAAATRGAPPAGATAKCKDGSYSTSKSHSGACSKHGGVTDWLPAS